MPPPDGHIVISPLLFALVTDTFIAAVSGALFFIHQRTTGVLPLQSWPATKLGPRAGWGRPGAQIEARMSRVGAAEPACPTQLAITGFGSLDPVPLNVPHLVWPPLTFTELTLVLPLKVTVRLCAVELLFVTR